MDSPFARELVKFSVIQAKLNVNSFVCLTQK